MCLQQLSGAESPVRSDNGFQCYNSSVLCSILKDRAGLTAGSELALRTVPLLELVTRALPSGEDRSGPPGTPRLAKVSQPPAGECAAFQRYSCEFGITCLKQQCLPQERYLNLNSSCLLFNDDVPFISTGFSPSWPGHTLVSTGKFMQPFLWPSWLVPLQ